MAWVKIDDHFDEHPKLAKVGPLAWGVWLAGIAYCNRNLTDGFIPWAKARTLASFEVADDDGTVWELGRASGMAGEDMEMGWIIDLLVGAGLWEEVANGRGRIDGYHVHDYLDYQPTRDHVLSEREAARERMKKRRSPELRANILEVRPKFENVRPKFADPVPVPNTDRANTLSVEPPLVPPSEESEKKEKTSRRRKLPSDFSVTDEMRHAAEGFGVPPDKVDFETERFKDWAAGGELKADWIATWRNWMARSVRMSGYDRQKAHPHASPNGMAPSPKEISADGGLAAWKAGGQQRRSG